MGQYEIELVLKNGQAVIGEADDESTALSLMEKAIRRHPTSHVRIRRGTAIVAEVEASEEKIDGEKATLINKANPNDKNPMTLKKAGAEGAKIGGVYAEGNTV